MPAGLSLRLELGTWSPGGPRGSVPLFQARGWAWRGLRPLSGPVPASQAGLLQPVPALSSTPPGNCQAPLLALVSAGRSARPRPRACGQCLSHMRDRVQVCACARVRVEGTLPRFLRIY